MADRLRLGQARQADGFGALAAAKARFGLLRLLEIDAARFRRADFENQRLLDLERAIAREGAIARGPRQQPRGKSFGISTMKHLLKRGLVGRNIIVGCHFRRRDDDQI